MTEKENYLKNKYILTKLRITDTFMGYTFQAVHLNNSFEGSFLSLSFIQESANSLKTMGNFIGLLFWKESVHILSNPCYI